MRLISFRLSGYGIHLGRNAHLQPASVDAQPEFTQGGYRYTIFVVALWGVKKMFSGTPCQRQTSEADFDMIVSENDRSNTQERKKEMRKNFKPFSGFTLIELLIVVAIIAILAAIAVPNFLEAQTRSKVSRMQADMRSLATAVESYQIDYNRLFKTSRAVGQTREFLWSKVTTPIAYMTSIPKDVFNNVDPNPGDRTVVIWGPDYIHGGSHGIAESPALATRSAVFFEPFQNYSDGTNLLKREFWVMFSLGPDRAYDILNPTFPSPMTPYDPTNGTVSNGDVVRFKS